MERRRRGEGEENVNEMSAIGERRRGVKGEREGEGKESRRRGKGERKERKRRGKGEGERERRAEGEEKVTEKRGEGE